MSLRQCPRRFAADWGALSMSPRSQRGDIVNFEAVTESRCTAFDPLHPSGRSVVGTFQLPQTAAAGGLLAGDKRTVTEHSLSIVL